MPWMPVENAQAWIDLLEQRPCGCYRHVEGDFSHWWKYTRLRYWCRCIGGWRHFLGIWGQWWWREKLLDLMEWATPIHLVFGMIGYGDAQDRMTRVENVRETNKKSLQEKLCLGADSDYPDGVYATAGQHMVGMTEGESRHW